jgi:hypothetical protein
MRKPRRQREQGEHVSKTLFFYSGFYKKGKVRHDGLRGREVAPQWGDFGQLFSAKTNG